jgi:hypothetical protein
VEHPNCFDLFYFIKKCSAHKKRVSCVINKGRNKF